MTDHSNFIDQVTIQVRAGDGGAGSASMRREKFVPRGGPDGGDGGRGGSVVFEADQGLNTLLDYTFNRMYEAGSGEKGAGQRKDGRAAKDLVLRVPCGTLIRDKKDGALLRDMKEPGEAFAAARGGRGGKGNTHFVNARHQAPRLAEKGEPGEEKELVLELKLLADVGLIGLPNAGKSTFLASVSAARPKIADYPFTTLHPKIGVVQVKDYSFVMADLPGLIEGAAAGAGLGHRFLRHVERTRALLYILDGSGGAEKDLWKDYQLLKKELGQYDRRLMALPHLVMISKADLAESREAAAASMPVFRKHKVRAFSASAAAGRGVQEILKELMRLLKDRPTPAALRAGEEAQAKVYRPAERFRLQKKGGAYILEGREVVKWLAMTDFESPEAVHRLKKILKKIGVSRALKELGAEDGDVIKVGGEEFIYESD